MGDSLPREIMDMEFELDDTDLEMLVAGPADDQYNDLLDREVLQQLGLFGTPADMAAGGAAGGAGGADAGGAGGSGGGNAAGSAGATAGGDAVPPARQLLSLFSLLTEADVNAATGAAAAATAPTDAPGGSSSDGSLQAQLASFMSLGGSAGGGAAAQVASLLAGSHPSARGANLAEWLAGDTPVVSLPDDAAAAPSGSGLGAGPRPAPALLPASTLSLPGLVPAIPTPPLSQQAADVPRMGAPLPLDRQLQLQAASVPVAAAAPQQPALVQLSMGGGLPCWQQPFGMQQQQQAADLAQQQQQQQQAAGLAQLLGGTCSPGSARASTGGLAGGDLAGAAGAGQQQAQFALPVLPEGAQLPPLASLDVLAPFAALQPQAPSAAATAGGVGEDEWEDEPTFSGGSAGSGGGGGGGGGGGKPSQKKFSNRQRTRIGAIEAELQRLQREMQAVKLENQRLKEKNLEVERQLCTQEQLQQLAAAVTAATGPVGLRAPPLAAAAATSPPNSQRKLLMHLTVSARPADAEMLKVAALTWPKLVDWCRQLHARCRDVVAGAPPVGCVEAEQAAKAALRAGRYWDLLVLICRPDLSARMLHEDLSAPPAAAPPAPGAAPPPGAAAWPAAALAALELTAAQRGALADAWRAHCEAAAQRAQRRQELLAAIRSGFLQPLQRGRPEELELGKPAARQGLEAMEALRLVVRQDQAAAVQVAAGLRKLLSPLQAARLFAAAWPFYPDPSKWAPMLLSEAG